MFLPSLFGKIAIGVFFAAREPMSRKKATS
jgi:hypothetical protein